MLLYRLYKLQILLFVASVLLPGMYRVIAQSLLGIAMGVMWIMLWIGMRLMEKQVQDERTMEAWLQKIQPRH